MIDNMKGFEKIKAIIILTAKMECRTDDEEFSAYDYSGGNIDDAHYNGVESGRIEFARELCDEMEWDYELS